MVCFEGEQAVGLFSRLATRPVYNTLAIVSRRDVQRTRFSLESSTWQFLHPRAQESGKVTCVVLTILRKNHRARLSRLLSAEADADDRHEEIAQFGWGFMRLSQEEVVYVAELARLGLSDDEVRRMQDQLSSILDHIAALNELDTDAIPPTAHVIAVTNVMRPDIVTGSLSREAVLANAPRQSDGFFEVQTILGTAGEDPDQ